MFKVNLIHISEKTLHEGSAKYVLLPGVMGEFEIGIDHAPIAALLCQGKIFVREDKEDEAKVVQIQQGLMRFDGKELFAVVE